MRRRAVVALVALDFTDLNHVGGGLTKPRVAEIKVSRRNRREIDAIRLLFAYNGVTLMLMDVCEASKCLRSALQLASG